jgi:hypothetical protein
MRKRSSQEKAEVHDGTMVVVLHGQNFGSNQARRIPHEHDDESYDDGLNY